METTPRFDQMTGEDGGYVVLHGLIHRLSRRLPRCPGLSEPNQGKKRREGSDWSTLVEMLGWSPKVLLSSQQHINVDVKACSL